MPAPAGATPGDSIETLYVDIAARADRLVADAEQAVDVVVRRMQQIDKAAENTGRTYSRLGATIKQALTIATGISFYNMTTQVITGVVNLGKQLISTNAQMQMFQKSFEVLTGSAQEAGEIIDWVRDQAKKTPFDVPGLINASQMLMTWGLDLKEWFTVVGDVAAGMNQPITRVVNAIGTLATGQTGEAVRRFRDLGINLREFTDVLKFDAQGSLITPLEEAIPIVKEIMIDKFGGMMESQSKTWEGVMSNMRDTWQQFVQVTGKPVFDILNERLIQLAGWVDENADQLEEFAVNLGNAFGATLTTLLDIVGAVGALVGKIEELTHTLENIPKAIDTARKFAGILSIAPAGIGAGLGTMADIGGAAFGAIKGEGFDLDALNARAAERMRGVRGTMLAVAGLSEKEKTLADIQITVTEQMKIGTAAVRELEGGYVQLFSATEATYKAFKDMTDEEIVALAATGKVTGAFAKNREELAAALGPFRFLTDAIADQDDQLTELVDTYEDAIAAEEAIKQAAAEAAAALEAQKQAIQETLDLAKEVAPGLTDTIDSAMEAMAEGLQKAGVESAEALELITAKAQQAELDAIAANQAAVTKLETDFARDQLRRRQQFNRQWERLIREQNDTNIDAAWEYEYQRQQLLIEGDEIALAELEARYKHEQDTRDRDQGQERSDMQEEFDRQQAELEAAFEERVKALEDRLQVELEKVRAEADAAAKAQVEKDEEARAKQEANAVDLHERLGEMLYDQTKGNDEAAALILSAWSQMYSGIEIDAIWTAYRIRAEMMSTINMILQAQSALNQLRNTPGSGYIPTEEEGDIGPWSHTGGYTPGVERNVFTKPGQFVTTPSTTQALEQALGARLTQSALQGLALSTTQRRLLDVNIKGTGVPANMLQRAYRDMIKAMTEESGEY